MQRVDDAVFLQLAIECGLANAQQLGRLQISRRALIHYDPAGRFPVFYDCELCHDCGCQAEAYDKKKDCPHDLVMLKVDQN